MAIKLGKEDEKRLIPLSEIEGGDSDTNIVEVLRERTRGRVYDHYCSASTRAELIKIAVSELEVEQSRATLIVDMELESIFCANEFVLCEELDGLLHRFTDEDKKLDKKEKNDAIQIVCRPKVGYVKGLSFDVAEKYLVDFCRRNRVKVKNGFLSWGVP